MNESYYRQKQNTFHDRALIALYLHRDRRHIRANIIQINSIQMCLWRIKPEQPSRSTVSLYACGQCECKSLFLGKQMNTTHLPVSKYKHFVTGLGFSDTLVFIFEYHVHFGKCLYCSKEFQMHWNQTLKNPTTFKTTLIY